MLRRNLIVIMTQHLTSLRGCVHWVDKSGHTLIKILLVSDCCTRVGLHDTTFFHLSPSEKNEDKNTNAEISHVKQSNGCKLVCCVQTGSSLIVRG